ncbi:MAG TPA: hypothetical protein VH575_07590 [Gemmataceae bacterium]|jgi:hypothetical protein
MLNPFDQRDWSRVLQAVLIQILPILVRKMGYVWLLARRVWECLLAPDRDFPGLTIGEVALRLNCQQWQIRKVCNLGLYPEPPRFGNQRAFRESDLPKIKEALRKAGYLK